jgi:uncharacterized protein GlcG (DUF336 family)
MGLSLDQAAVIVSATLARARELGLAPLSVAVLDAGGHLVSFAREDGSSTLRPQIAVGKAATALALGMSSRQVATMAAERPTFVAALGGIAPQGIVPAAGGLLVTDAQGTVIGAVGVTGDTSDNDEAAARAGLAAAGLGTKG